MAPENAIHRVARLLETLAKEVRAEADKPFEERSQKRLDDVFMVFEDPNHPLAVEIIGKDLDAFDKEIAVLFPKNS